MNYAKLINGQPEWAPNPIKIDGYTVSNPGPDILVPLGYKEVIYDEQPEPEDPPKSYRPVYAEETDHIRVGWEEYTPEPEIPMPEPIPESQMRQTVAFARMSINTIALSDEQSLEVKDLYPEWSGFIGKSLEKGVKVLHENRLYKVRQAITTVLENQPPSTATAALYEEIVESAAGTLEDPIPYNGNQELFEGKYYTQGGATYKCIRSTGQPVYNDLGDLVGLYVERV